MVSVRDQIMRAAVRDDAETLSTGILRERLSLIAVGTGGGRVFCISAWQLNSRYYFDLEVFRDRNDSPMSGSCEPEAGAG